MARKRATAYVGPVRGRPLFPYRSETGTSRKTSRHERSGTYPHYGTPVRDSPVVEIPVEDVAGSIVPEARDTDLTGRG